MMRYFVLSCTVLIVSFSFGQKNSVDLDPQTKIELATHFLTAQEKEGAKVIAYLEDGSTEVLKASEGHLTCVYDDPKKEGIQFVCYHSQLEDFMTRGRVLKAQGVSTIEIRNKRKEEIEAGKLFFPKGQSMMYVFDGKEENIDAETGVVKEGKLRYVIYTPFATQESTGLPLSPSAPGMPWLMDPGTHRAHIMVSPM